jgi:hypothetical protein
MLPAQRRLLRHGPDLARAQLLQARADLLQSPDRRLLLAGPAVLQ